MIIQNRDGSLVHGPSHPRPDTAKPRYYVQVPADLLDEQSSLIERIISFAFDTLGARHLDMRVRDAE